jgi:hypothetical protein
MSKEIEGLWVQPWNMTWGVPVCYQFKDGDDGHYYFGPMINIAALYDVDEIVAIWRLKKRNKP